MPTSFPSDEDLRHAAVRELLAVAGLDEEFHLVALAGGANNRVYRIDVNGASSLLKFYFQHPSDPRDRLRAEFSFTSFAWACGLRMVPRPLACSPDHALGLYEFVDGRRPRAGEVTEDMIGQALAFFLQLNRHRDGSRARSLLPASEVCPRIGDHLQSVERRIARLAAIEPVGALDRDVLAFVRNELSATWMAVRDAVRQESGCSEASDDEAIARTEWCLSPSDFGFHNTLMAPDGRLRFIDFEYAGWDDPARMVCDFVCQPQVPVPPVYQQAVMDAVAASVPSPPRYQRRVRLLLPVYRIKWCCILLNDFLPEGQARRRFAGSDTNGDERRAGQLQKARSMLRATEP